MAQGSSQSQATSSSTTSHLDVKAPRGSVGMRSRSIGGGGNSSSGGMGGSGSGSGAENNILRFYTNDAPSLKISPTVMLVMNLCFIGFVTAIHVFGKLYLYRSTDGA